MNKLRSPPGPQAPFRQSKLRETVTSNVPMDVTPETIMIGENRSAFAALNAIRKNSRPDPPGKAVFEVDFQGVHYIAKCWGPNLDES